MARRPVISTAILALMRGQERHAWTLEDLHAGLVAQRHAADFSTVFRAAEKLAGSGEIRKLALDDGKARFELLDKHHDHLHCVSCGELVAVRCPIGANEFGALERDAGIAILGHHLVLNGLCRECRTPSLGGAA